MQKLASYLSNTFRQVIAPETKVFFIGFNKCGTTSLHHLMKRAGIRSAHWQNGTENLTEGIEARLGEHRELRRYLSRWTAYSDLISSADKRIIEGNRHFALFQNLFPKAYFILNDRDLDAWLLSRERHAQGKFMRQSIKFHNTAKEGVLDIWRNQYLSHTQAVTEHFAGHERFLRYRIDRDPIEQLVDFLAPDFKIPVSNWHNRNKTSV